MGKEKEKGKGERERREDEKVKMRKGKDGKVEVKETRCEEKGQDKEQRGRKA